MAEIGTAGRQGSFAAKYITLLGYSIESSHKSLTGMESPSLSTRSNSARGNEPPLVR